MALEKAKLQEITSADPASPVGEPVDVQFNPSSLRLKLSNQVEGGQTRGRQARQYTGSSSTTLTLDLHFDTADEGTTGRPRSVREKTALIEKFVLPKHEGKQAPPKVRFLWGTLVFDGVIGGLDIDFDHFASDGTPLRAKMGVTIQEQEAKYQYLQAGPGANRPPQGTPGAAADRVASALGGESPAELAARLGLDPGAWRGLGLDLDLSAGLSLEAGLEVGFRGDLSASAGLGVRLGVDIGASASMEASLGLAAGAGADPRSSGLAVSAAGGVGPALETAKIARSEAAVAATREAFRAAPAGAAASAGGATAVTAGASAPRTPLTTTGPRTPAQQQAAPPAPPPPRADPRATGFGAGVPLRPRFAAAADERNGGLSGDGQVPARSGTGAVPELPSATAAPWLGLRPADPGRARADETQVARRPRSPCGCLFLCRHRKRP